MSNRIFSTGVISAMMKTPYTPLFVVGPSGAGGVNAGTNTGLSALSDGNPATTATAAHNAGHYDMFQADLGSSLTISSVVLSNATVGSSDPGAVVSVFASDTNFTSGSSTVPVDAVYFTPPAGNVAPVTNANLLFVAPAGTVRRYVYVLQADGTTAGVTLTVGELVINTAIPVGIIQSATLDHPLTRKELFDSAMNGTFAVDNADHMGKPVFKIEHADMNLALLAYIISAVLATIVTPAGQSATIAQALRILPFGVTYAVLRRSGTTRVIQANNAKAAGHTTALKIDDFAKGTFDLYLYDDSAGVVYTTQDN